MGVVDVLVILFILWLLFPPPPRIMLTSSSMIVYEAPSNHPIHHYGKEVLLRLGIAPSRYHSIRS
jgi:hypothetical protein